MESKGRFCPSKLPSRWCPQAPLALWRLRFCDAIISVWGAVFAILPLSLPSSRTLLPTVAMYGGDVTLAMGGCRVMPQA